MAIDLIMNKSKGYFDFEIANGDFKATYGLDSALLMSIYLDKRADKSEISRPELRRGWWGNLVNNFVNYEIGSKLWLLSQARKDNNTLNLVKTYAYDCLKWMIEDQIASKIDVSSSYQNESLILTIVIYRNQNIIISNVYVLWDNTLFIANNNYIN
jgi:phage gp46-like protein